MQTATIKGFFNPTHKGDTFKGLNGSIEGEVAPDIIQGIQPFLKAAGRDYFIKKTPAGVFDSMGAVDASGAVVPGWLEVENQYHLVRSSDNRVVSPHTVSDQYAPLSLMDMAEELQPWCDQGWATPDGVYSGRNESLEVLSLRLDAGGQLPQGETFKFYTVFQNPHGSGGTAKGKIIPFRIICGNTFAAAVGAACDFTISHRVASGDHVKQQEIMAERAKDAISAWQKVQDHIAKLAERINVLSSVKLSAKDAEHLTDTLLGIKDVDKASTRSMNRRAAILAGFSMPTMGTQGRTAWDWINGVTFVNSSPMAEINSPAKSKVSGIDRAIRTMDTNGSGFKLELDANKVLANFIG